jgi:DNA polymerase I-like protein with 3'-5' exonuclease and polymerase domains
MDVMTCKGPIVGIDSETEPITTKSKTPPGVIAGFSCHDQVDLVWWEHWDEYIPKFLANNPTVKLSFFNLGFDVSVMGEEYFLPELDKEGRVLELQAAYPSKRVATVGWFSPKFTLETLTSELLGEQLDKDESIRLTYKRDMELTDKHLIYLSEDCISTELLGVLLNNQPTESIQARAAYVLAEISRNGKKVDKDFLYKQQELLVAKIEELRKKLRLFGYIPKPKHEQLGGKDLFDDICKVFGITDSLDILNDIKSIPAWAFKIMFVYLYAHASDKDLPSVVADDLRDLMFLIKSQPKNMNKSDTIAQVNKLAEEILVNLDAAEVVAGLGDAKPTSGSDPWKAFSYEIAQSYASGDCLKNGMANINARIIEHNEDNLGWLSTSPKRMSTKDFLQTHIKKLLKDYPSLELELTESSQKNIKEAIRNESVLAKKEKRLPNPVDVTDLQVYTITKSDKWRLEDCGIDDAFLEVYFEYQHAQKLLSTYITDKYIDEFDGRVHPRMTLYARTGRTTCQSPNLQNLPQESGLRDQYIPEDGNVFIACDYGQEELVALAQTCYTKYGFSVMRELINRKLDLHAMTAAYNEGKVPKDIGRKIANMSENELTNLKTMLKWYKEDKAGKKKRQMAKALNFGLPGKMSTPTLYKHMRKNGVQITLEESDIARTDWVSLYTEMNNHFTNQKDGTIKESELKRNKTSVDDDEGDEEEDDVILFDAQGNPLAEKDRTVQLYRCTNILGMVKARGSANACCNFDFQPVAAVANKIALWNLFYGEWKRAKDTGTAVRYKMCNFIHDEVIVEAPEPLMDEVARHLQEVMVTSAKQVFKDVYLEAEASVMRRWSKAAEPAFDKNGKYIPYEDETVVCADCGKEILKLTAQKNERGELICEECNRLSSVNKTV